MIPAAPTELPIVDPAIWGPHLWRFLHTAAEGTTNDIRRKPYWDRLFEAMRTGLPCPECTEHYNAWYAAVPLAVTDDGGLRAPVTSWLLDLHNAVNTRRGVATWTAEQLTAEYGTGGRPGARAALAEAAAAGVGPEVIRAGELLLRWAMA